jgi:hypothetical protein
MTCIMHTSSHWCQLPGIYQSEGAGVGKLYLSQYQKFSPVCSVNLKKTRRVLDLTKHNYESHEFYRPIRMALRRLWKHYNLKLNCFVCYEQSDWSEKVIPRIYHIIRYLWKRVWRYPRGNQNPYIYKEQTTQWPKEKGQKDKHRSIKHYTENYTNITKIRRWTHVLRKDKQFLLH